MIEIRLHHTVAFDNTALMNIYNMFITYLKRKLMPHNTKIISKVNIDFMTEKQQ